MWSGAHQRPLGQLPVDTRGQPASHLHHSIRQRSVESRLVPVVVVVPPTVAAGSAYRWVLEATDWSALPLVAVSGGWQGQESVAE